MLRTHLAYAFMFQALLKQSTCCVCCAGVVQHYTRSSIVRQMQVECVAHMMCTALMLLNEPILVAAYYSSTGSSMKLYPQLSTAVHNICSTVCSECSADCFCAELILVAAYCTVAPRWHWFVYESFMMYPLLSTAVHDICNTVILSQ